MSSGPRSTSTVFYAYARKDEPHLVALRSHLKLLKRQGRISDWYDRDITAGSAWEDVLDANLEKSDIILLLVSPSFIESDYCWGKEMKRALERERTGTALVIPVIVRTTPDWETAPFAYLQALPRDGKPVTEWTSRDKAWADVAMGIRVALDRLAKHHS